jgi:hypothetical protein
VVIPITKLIEYIKFRKCSRKSRDLCHQYYICRHITEILDLRAEKPSLQVLFIPGNPGFVPLFLIVAFCAMHCWTRKTEVSPVSLITAIMLMNLIVF